MRYSRHYRPGQELPNIFYYSFGGVGALLFLIAAVIFYFDQKAANQYVKMKGVVVENAGRSKGLASPVISYSWQGNEMLYYSSTSTNPPAFEEGESVEIFVNPNDPKDVLVNSFSERYLAMTIVGGIGAVFLGFLALFHYLSPRNQ